MSKVSINISDIRPNSVVITICQTTLTFRQRSGLAVWLSVALYEARSAKNLGQVYGCKVYLKLYFLASLDDFKYPSSALFKLLVSVNLAHSDRIGLEALVLVTEGTTTLGKRAAVTIWARLGKIQLDMGKDSCPVTEPALLLHANELQVIRVLSLKTS